MSTIPKRHLVYLSEHIGHAHLGVLFLLFKRNMSLKALLAISTGNWLHLPIALFIPCSFLVFISSQGRLSPNSRPKASSFHHTSEPRPLAGGGAQLTDKSTTCERCHHHQLLPWATHSWRCPSPFWAHEHAFGPGRKTESALQDPPGGPFVVIVKIPSPKPFFDYRGREKTGWAPKPRNRAAVWGEGNMGSRVRAEVHVFGSDLGTFRQNPAGPLMV